MVSTPKIKIITAAVSIALAVVLLVAVAAGLKSFELTYQAWDLWREGETPLSAFRIGHPHATRYLLYYPVFLISQFTTLPVDLVFSLFCVTMLLILWTTLSAIEGLLDPGGIVRKLAYIVLFFGLSTIMNGRLILAFTGFALLIWVFVSSIEQTRWRAYHAAVLAIGSLLMSVSSGTLSVAALYMFLATLWILIFGSAFPKADRRGVLVSTTVLLVAFSPILSIGLFKNIDYFGGGISGAVGMLDHGIGRVFLRFGTLGVIAAGVGGLAACAVVILIAGPMPLRFAVILLSVLPAAIGGLFGISTLVVGLVPAVLLLRKEAVGWLLLRRSDKAASCNAATRG